MVVAKEVETAATTAAEESKESEGVSSEVKKSFTEYVGCPLKECVIYPFKNSGYAISK